MYKKNIRLLKIFNFLIGLSLFAPLAIIYFSRVSGSYALGASIFGITMLSSAIFEVPTGIWSDRVGRRGTIILGSWARVLAFMLYAIGLSYWWLVAGAFLEGLSRALYSGNNDAFLHDTLADSGVVGEYEEHLGKTSSLEQLALGLSAVAGSLIANFSFSYLMWISVFTQILLLITSYRFIEPQSRSTQNPNIYAHIKQALKLFVTNRKLRLLSLGSIVSFAFGENKFQFRAAFINTVWPIWAIGLGNFMSNMGASASFMFSGKIIKKVKEVNILLFSSIYGKTIGLIAFGFPSIISPVLLSTTSLLHGVKIVAETKLFQQEFSDHQRATMSSLNSLGGSLLFFVMSLVLGKLADIWSPATALIILTLIEYPTVLIYWRLFRSDGKISS